MIRLIIIGLMLFIFIVYIITKTAININIKAVNSMENIYINQLTDDEVSIKNAVNYLQLTNSIKE